MAIDVSNTPDGYTINVSGSFTFNTTCGVRAEPDMSATALAAYHAGDTVYYTSKLKSGNHFWLSYTSYSGEIRYVPYQNTDTEVMFGTDSNSEMPIKPSDGGDIITDRPQGGTDTGTPSLTGVKPLSTLDGYEFPMKGYVYMISGAQTREKPDFSLPGIAKHPADPDKKTPVHYVAKTNGSNRMWIKFQNGHYLPIGQFKVGLPDLTKTKDRHDIISTYVEDRNVNQPWESIWPYIKLVKGHNDKTGADFKGQFQDWETNFDMVNTHPSTSFTPTAAEQARLAELHNQVTSGAHDDDVLIAYINDTHFDSYETPSTANVLRSMMLMSWYSKHYGVDLVIHGGDLNDGVKPKKLSEIDTKLGVDAIKTSQRPYIILQGNHDDNSGYVRDEAALQTDQLIGSSEEWSLRGSKWLKRPTGSQNPNNAVFGTYEVPNSNVTIIVLDGFDQPDILTTDGAPHWGSFRHGATHFSSQQITWLQNTLNSMPTNRKVMFFNHISLNGGNNMSWINDLQEEKKFEYSGSNTEGVNESKQVFSIIKDYQAKTNNVIGYVSGHTHHDAYTIPSTSGNVQFVTLTCGLADRGDGGSIRDTDELNNAWSIFRVSATNGSVDQFRYGYKHSTGFKDSWNFKALK